MRVPRTLLPSRPGAAGNNMLKYRKTCENKKRKKKRPLGSQVVDVCSSRCAYAARQHFGRIAVDIPSQSWRNTCGSSKHTLSVLHPPKITTRARTHAFIFSIVPSSRVCRRARVNREMVLRPRFPWERRAESRCMIPTPLRPARRARFA